MKRIKNLKEKLILELQSLKSSRKNIDEYNTNFMANFYESSKLMHYILNSTKKEFPFEIAYRQYFVFLVSGWETYFRDIFILCYTLDENSMNNLLNQFDIDDKIENRLLSSNLTIVDLISKQFNFQNLESTNNAFSILIEEVDFLEYISKIVIPRCYVSNKKTLNFSIYDLFKDYQEVLKTAFETRHKVIHDSNYRPVVDISLIAKIEALFLLIPQVVTLIIAQKFNLPILMMNNNEKEISPFFCNMKDILSEDWEIIKEENKNET